MELYDLKFSKYTRFSVSDVDDYNIKGTFDPNAACDTEFFGYRETTFNIICVESKVQDVGYELWLPEPEESVSEFVKYFDNNLTLIVQNEIDRLNGEHHE